MKNFVGLDVSPTNCAVCVLQEDGTRVFEGECSTDPGEIIKTISLHADCVERTVHESRSLSAFGINPLLSP
ncbi:hypothetical protein [Ruegeria atlantica]|uniref:hypothetical protein n=1 Tax=Ruegeria atlantica TaxID=81569 RepID=UPI00147F731C|nr:hypothetical protein [Ruegeria atlantica]